MLRILLLAIFCVGALSAEAPREASAYEGAVIDGREAQRKGLLGKAIEAFDRAIKLDPQKVAAYFFKGEVLVAQRKSEEAVVLFSKVIELDAKASTAYRVRGEERFKLGEIEKSVAD